MKNFKTYSAIAAGLMMIALLLVPVSESKGHLDGIDYLIHVTQMKSQHATDEASRSAEDQRKLVKQQELPRSQPGRLTARELAREKTVLKQLQANARRSAEVLESVKRLAAELARQQRR